MDSKIDCQLRSSERPERPIVWNRRGKSVFASQKDILLKFLILLFLHRFLADYLFYLFYAFVFGTRLSVIFIFAKVMTSVYSISENLVFPPGCRPTGRKLGQSKIPSSGVRDHRLCHLSKLFMVSGVRFQVSVKSES